MVFVTYTFLQLHGLLDLTLLSQRYRRCAILLAERTILSHHLPSKKRSWIILDVTGQTRNAASQNTNLSPTHPIRLNIAKTGTKIESVRYEE